MRRTTRPAPRPGFTLIELLVVIGILAILAALVAATVGKIRTGQMSATTDQTLSKLQLALNKQVQGVAESARDLKGNVDGNLVAICGGDVERARSLYAHLKLKQQLPQTFAEAQTDVVVQDMTGTVVFNRLPKLKTFAAVPATTTLTPEEQGAVLLYLALSEKGAFAADDVTAGAQGDVGGFRVFKDAWGTPITFVRAASFPEVQLPPFVKNTTPPQQAKDPFDLSPPSTMPKGRLEASTWVNKMSVLNGDGTTHGLNANLPTSLHVAFDGSNKVATVVSAGGDKEFLGGPGDSDNSYGFRLLRQGNKGD